MTYESLKNKDMDVFLGNWMPTMASIIGPYEKAKQVDVVRANLEGAKYTLAVPTYLADEGLKSFADIAKFKDQLDGKIYGIEPGNDGNKLIQSMIDKNAFGLGGFEVVESSEQGMLAEVARKARSKAAIVFLGWEPHPMNTNFAMTYLSGGDDWFGPNYGGATVYTNVRAGYVKECPNVGKLLDNLVFSLKMENEIMKSHSRRRQGSRRRCQDLAEGQSRRARWLARGRDDGRRQGRPRRSQDLPRPLGVPERAPTSR